MEIRFSHVEVGNQKDLCFVLPNESISAIAGEGKEEVLKLIGEEFPSKGNIYYNGKRKLKRDQKEYVKDIKYIPMNFQKELPFENVYEYFTSYIRYHHIPIKKLEEKIQTSLKILGLKKEILEKNMSALSSCEQKKIQFSLALLENPSLFLLEEPLLSFNQKESKEMMAVLEKLTDKFHKTIIIATEDHNLIYQYAKHLVFLKKEKALEGTPEEIYYGEEECEKPEIVKFIQLVEKEKGVRLDRRKDIRDLIKDIYRSVS